MVLESCCGVPMSFCAQNESPRRECNEREWFVSDGALRSLGMPYFDGSKYPNLQI